MQVRALSDQIASFGIGSTPMVVDDVCFTPMRHEDRRAGAATTRHPADHLEINAG